MYKYNLNCGHGLHLRKLEMMKVLVAICVIIFVFSTKSSSTPIGEDDQMPEYMEYDNRQPSYQRGQRLSENYYAITPCAAAAAARSFSPNLYQNNPRFVHGTYDYGSQGLGHMYRAEDPYIDNMESLSFSDMNVLEEAPTSRSNYRIAPSSLLLKGSNIASLNNHLVHQVAPAVYGVFPNGNTGGCNVPLFFSCTPSVVSGRVARSEPQVYNTPVIGHPETYRGVTDYLHGLQTNYAEQVVHDHITPVKSDTIMAKEIPT